ncbi:MAG: 6-pyruvoyl trahydropterin synthase family protein, partial [Chitinophagales bacterium]
ELSDIIKREVVERFDHQNLNLDTPYFENMQPSTENFVKVIWNILKPHISGCELHCIKLQETENIYAEYFGE